MCYIIKKQSLSAEISDKMRNFAKSNLSRTEKAGSPFQPK